MATTDLQYTVEFKDGSYFTDVFRRYYEMNNNCDLVPTTKFINDFMSFSDDLLSSRDIKDNFVQWLETNNTNYVKITWKFVN